MQYSIQQRISHPHLLSSLILSSFFLLLPWPPLFISYVSFYTLFSYIYEYKSKHKRIHSPSSPNFKKNSNLYFRELTQWTTLFMLPRFTSFVNFLPHLLYLIFSNTCQLTHTLFSCTVWKEVADIMLLHHVITPK